MAPPLRGFGGTIGAGIEAVWGTAVARTNWKEMVSMGLRRTIDTPPVPELGRLGQVSSAHRFDYIATDFAGGPISYVACYDDSTILLLSHLLGGVADSGVGPYTHLLTLASPPPIGLTLEQINGTAPTGSDLVNKTTQVFEGCKFASGKISVTAGGLLMVENEVIAQTSGGLVAAGTPTYTSGGERIRHNHSSGMTLGGSARALQSFSLDIDRGLNRNHELGSLFTSEPWEEQLEITGEIRVKWQTDAFDAAYLAGTQADLVIPFTGSGSNAMTLTCHNIRILDVTRDVNSKGAVEQVIKFAPRADATDQGVSLSFVNASALFSAN